jgi:hypothetical protein
VPVTPRLLCLPLLLAVAACSSVGDEAAGQGTPDATRPVATSSPEGGIRFTNDGGTEVRLLGCTDCGGSGVAVPPGASQPVALPEGTRVLRVADQDRERCFHLSFGVLPAPPLLLRASEAGGC